MATRTTATFKNSRTATVRDVKLTKSASRQKEEACLQNAVSFYTKKELASLQDNITSLIATVKKNAKVAALIDSDPHKFISKYMGFLKFPTEKKGVYLSVEDFASPLTKAKAKQFVNSFLSNYASTSINAFLYNTTFLWTYVHFWTKTTSISVPRDLGSRVQFNVSTAIYAQFRDDLKRMKDLDLTELRTEAMLRRAVLNPTAILEEKKANEVITRKVEYVKEGIRIRATIRLKDRVCTISSVEVK